MTKVSTNGLKNGEKQGLGFILSLVVTLNNINIIKTHDKPSKVCNEDVTQRSFFCGSKEDENCIGIKKHTLNSFSTYMGTARCH